MNTQNLLNVVSNEKYSKRKRIEAIKRLDTTEMERETLVTLRQLVEDSGQLDICSYAAAAIARADNEFALDLCNEILEQLLEPSSRQVVAGQRQTDPTPKPAKPKPPPLAQVIRDILLPQQRAWAAAGEKDVWVVNTMSEISLKITDGPYLNLGGQGTLEMMVDLGVDALKVNVRKRNVYLDLIFLTAPPEILGSFQIHPDGRVWLEAPLPKSLKLEDILPEEPWETDLKQLDLPQKAFAFRIWWA